jgi:hypothetical protein
VVQVPGLTFGSFVTKGTGFAPFAAKRRKFILKNSGQIFLARIFHKSFQTLRRGRHAGLPQMGAHMGAPLRYQPKRLFYE